MFWENAKVEVIYYSIHIFVAMFAEFKSTPSAELWSSEAFLPLFSGSILNRYKPCLLIYFPALHKLRIKEKDNSMNPEE